MATPAAILITALWAATGAEATPRDPGPHIQVRDCPDELRSRLPALIRLEVDVLLRERGTTRVSPEDVAVRCAGDVAAIEVTRSGARRASTVAVGTLAPEHRARALALAVAELVDALGAIPSPSPPPLNDASASRPAPAPPPALPGVAIQRAAAASRGDEHPPVLLAGGLAEWLGRPAALMFGARLAYRHPFGALLAPMVSLDGALGDASANAGRISARTLAGAAHLFVGTSAGRVRLEGGAGARFGWAHLTGHPPSGSVVEGRGLSAWWGGPELRLRASLVPRQRGAEVALELGGGVVTLPVRGLVDGAVEAYAVQGTWLSIALQLGLELGPR